MSSRLKRRAAAIACSVFMLTLADVEAFAASERGHESVDSTAAGVSWSATPNQLTLPGALELAKRIHPDLRVAEANLAVARADSLFAKVPPFNPEVEIRTSRGGRSLGSGAESALELGVSQELELWGKRDARRRLATARSRTVAVERDATMQDIESEIRARFERALYLQDRLATLVELTDLDRRVVLASQARVRDGSITPLTGRLTELDLLRLEAQGRRTFAEHRQALVALGLAIGRQFPESLRLNGELDADSLRAPEDSVVALAFRVRAEGEVLRRRIVERRAELHLAQREARPNLTLGVGLARERTSLTGDDFFGDPAIVGGIAGARNTDNLWTAHVSAPLPLWQKNQRGRAVASAEIARSLADYDRYRLRTELAAVAAARRFQDAARLYQLYLQRSARVRQDLGLVREAYADGRISLESYLTQKGRLVDTLIGQLEAADAYWEARGTLEAAVGLDLATLNSRGGR